MKIDGLLDQQHLKTNKYYRTSLLKRSETGEKFVEQVLFENKNKNEQLFFKFILDKMNPQGIFTTCNIIHDRYSKTLSICCFSDHIKQIIFKQIKILDISERIIKEYKNPELHPFTIAAKNHESGQQLHELFNNVFVVLKSQERPRNARRRVTDLVQRSSGLQMFSFENFD